MDVFSSYPADHWDKQFKEDEQKAALSDLESGKVLYYPELRFTVHPEEQPLFVPYFVDPNTKNISFNSHTNALHGVHANANYQRLLKSMLSRFSQYAKKFMTAVFPYYSHALLMGRTSYRPVQIKDRKSSIRKDDTRLHVDAFPANPNQGKRILRLFCNVNPYGENRVWRIGEAFPYVANYFLPKISKPFPGSAKFFYWVGVTKSIRTYYDHIMLRIHDLMKRDVDYQKRVNYTEIQFPPDSSWIVSTDQVSHAALSGQYSLEQTFYLPVTAMKNPELAPLAILEDLMGHRLI